VNIEIILYYINLLVILNLIIIINNEYNLLIFIYLFTYLFLWEKCTKVVIL
jgi:hypothetical protein